MTLEELRDAVSRHIEEYRDAYNETGDERYRAVKNELLHVLGLIDAVDGKPVGNPGKLTLEELAREMRKVFKFKYLTCDNGSEVNDLCLWMDLPLFKQGEWFGQSSDSIKMFVEVNTLSVDLDLSEYKGADGNIDYSKSIVEVADASE